MSAKTAENLPSRPIPAFFSSLYTARIDSFKRASCASTCSFVTLFSAKRDFVSVSTAWFLATAASTAALFSSFTSFLESSAVANLLVTSASDEALTSAVLASERDFSAGVAFFSASDLAAAFSASNFFC